jgi:hypothetical protein
VFADVSSIPIVGGWQPRAAAASRADAHPGQRCDEHPPARPPYWAYLERQNIRDADGSQAMADRRRERDAYEPSAAGGGRSRAEDVPHVGLGGPALGDVPEAAAGGAAAAARADERPEVVRQVEQPMRLGQVIDVFA